MNRNAMRKTWIVPAFVIGCLVLAGSRVDASPVQSPQPASDSYSWHGELVALDEGTRMLTVKSSVVGDQALTELKRFKAGDRIVLTWSAFDKYADAILRVEMGNAAKKSDERFTFPVEFVAFDGERKYLTFKTEIPASSISELKQLKPGEWVTATSPHRLSSPTAAFVKVDPYVGSRGSTD